VTLAEEADMDALRERVVREVRDYARCLGPTPVGIAYARRLLAVLPTRVEDMDRARLPDLVCALAALSFRDEGVDWGGVTWRADELASGRVA
jgi:hypothetical protein